MKCYYELLGVARDADDNEIKTAYRKLALKWHPDKNIDNTELAKEQFQLVQQAYDVLSDRQERAWYDKHREQILCGADSEYTDDSLDVFPYFTTQCFSGYGDDERGFYSVYRKVFEKIAMEDMQHMESKSEFDEIPEFGHSTSDYAEVVAPFYAYWSSYSTKKSYVWLDPININDTVNRRHARLVEKHNKKIRQKAKKERNEEIQTLVAFVRKRDKRVQAYAKLLEAKNAEKRQKQEQLRKQKLLERKQELNNHNAQAEWTKFDNVESELKLMEKSLAEEFGESVTDSDSSDAENKFENIDEVFCAACNKYFKSKQARINHDSSKKHRENLNNLIRHLQETEELYKETNSDLTDVEQEVSEHEPSEVIENGGNVEPDNEDIINQKSKKKNKDKKVIRLNEHIIDGESGDESAELEISDDSSKKQKKKNKQKVKQNNLSSEADISQDCFNEEVPSLLTSEFEFSSTRKQKKKNMKQINKQALNGTDIEVEKTANIPSKSLNKKLKNSKKNSGDSEDIDLSHCCAKCKSTFDSKNKLFDHLKKTGHSIMLPQKESKTKKKTIK